MTTPREWTPNPTQARVLDAVTARVGPEAAETLRESWIAAGLDGDPGDRDPLDAIAPEEIVQLFRKARRGNGAGAWAARRRLSRLLRGKA